MNAIPDKAEGDKSKDENKPRREGMAGIEMPDCDAHYIVGYLFEIGPSIGEQPLSHGELLAWQQNTGIELNAWESRILRRLSIEYMNESHKAKAIDCPSPWQKELTEIDRAAVSSKVQNAFKLMIDTKPRR